MTHTAFLPDDVLLYIFDEFNTASSLIKIGGVSRQWRKCSQATLKRKLRIGINKYSYTITLNNETHELLENENAHAFSRHLSSLGMLCPACGIEQPQSLYQQCQSCSLNSTASPSLWMNTSEAMRHFALKAKDMRELNHHRIVASPKSSPFRVYGSRTYYYPHDIILQAALNKHGGLEDILGACQYEKNRKRKRIEEKQAHEDNKLYYQKKRAKFLEELLHRQYSDATLQPWMEDALGWIQHGHLPKECVSETTRHTKAARTSKLNRMDCSIEELQPILASQLKVNRLIRQVKQQAPDIDMKGYEVRTLMNKEHSIEELAEHIRYFKWREARNILADDDHDHGFRKYVHKDFRWLLSSKTRLISLKTFEDFWQSFQERHQAPVFARSDIKSVYDELIREVLEDPRI